MSLLVLKEFGGVPDPRKQEIDLDPLEDKLDHGGVGRGDGVELGHARIALQLVHQGIEEIRPRAVGRGQGQDVQVARRTVHSQAVASKSDDCHAWALPGIVALRLLVPQQVGGPLIEDLFQDLEGSPTAGFLGIVVASEFAESRFQGGAAMDVLVVDHARVVGAPVVVVVVMVLAVLTPAAMALSRVCGTPAVVAPVVKIARLLSLVIVVVGVGHRSIPSLHDFLRIG